MSEILIGMFASGLAAVFTNPLEVLRTKMIVVEEEAKYSGENKNRQKFRQAWQLTGPGLKSLEKGLTPSLAFIALSNGIRLGFFSSMQSRGYLKREGSDRLSFGCSISVATGGALISRFAANPLLVIKTRMQLSGGESPKNPVVETIKDIYQKKGILGFYKNVFRSMPIVALSSVTQLVSFAFVQERLVRSRNFDKGSFFLTSIPSVASSFVIVACTNPVENCLTKLQYQERRGSNDYGNSFRKIYQKEGLRIFYGGSFISFLRVFPHNVITLCVWDLLRKRHQQMT